MRPCIPVGAEADAGFSASPSCSGRSPVSPQSSPLRRPTTSLKSSSAAPTGQVAQPRTANSTSASPQEDPCSPTPGRSRRSLADRSILQAAPGGSFWSPTPSVILLNPKPLAHFSLSYNIGEDDHCGMRLTNKPLSRDNIGHPVTQSPNNVGAVHVEVLNAGGLAPLVYPDALSD